MLRAAAAEKPLPDEQRAGAMWWRLSRHLSPAAVAATGDGGEGSLRPSWSRELIAGLGDLRAARVMADPAWPALVAAVNRAVGSGWEPGQLLADIHAADPGGVRPGGQVAIDDGHGQLLLASDLAEALVWRVAALTDPAPLHGYEPPPDPVATSDEPPEDLHLLDLFDPPAGGQPTGNPDNGATHPSEGESARYATVPGGDRSEPPSDVQGYEEALFHAARRRDYAPEPDFDTIDTERQLAQANRWDHAPVSRARLLALNEMAADYFTANYADSWGPAYVASRLGTNLADHPTFRPGYAPASWTSLTDHLRRGGASEEEILAAGLGRVASTGRIIDQFRDRLVLPIHNKGQIHGFIGRRNPTAADDGKAGPKYLNTPASDLFDKSAQLFGLCEGQGALGAGATPVLVEGFFDAIAITLSGDSHHVGVAPLGTSLTDAQANQLRPFIGPDRPGVTIATDADLAGEIAAQRAYWMLSARGDNPRHAAMRGGKDPAEILQYAGTAALRAALNEAPPLARHLLDERLNHPGDQSQVLPDIADIIAAQPPHTWMEQVDYVTARTNLDRGAVQQAVADAADQWTLDPIGRANNQIADLAAIRTRPRPAVEAQLRAWQQMAHSINPNLTAGEDWPVLARAIQEAHSAGFDVARQVQQLASSSKLPAERPATELAYRLRTVTQSISDTEPTNGAQQKQTPVDAVARSLPSRSPSGRQPGRPAR